MSKPKPVAWLTRDNDDEEFSVSLIEPDVCWEKKPLYPSSALQALEEENARLRQHVEELQQKNAAETCACSYDGPGTVCDGHSPKLTAAEARLEEALKVIEPFAKSDMQDPDWREDNSCVAGTCDFTVGHLRAASRFMEESRANANQDKSDG